jgi:bifunctional non-homologous end joining protein LigD
LLVYIRADDERVPTSTARAVATALPGLETPECPFANLPEVRAGRWGEGLTAAKMKNCRW